MAHEPEEHSTTNGAGYEVEDAGVREIVFTGIGLAVGTILICFAVLGLFKAMSVMDEGRQAAIEIPTPQTFPPGPRLQQHPWEELQVVRKREDEMLTTYGWVNKDAGTVRIPVSRAMDTIVERGLPVRQEPSAVAAQRREGGGNASRK